MLVSTVSLWIAAAEEQSSTDENSASESCGVSRENSRSSSDNRKGSDRLSAAELATLAGRIASIAASAVKVAQLLCQLQLAPELALNDHWYVHTAFLAFQVYPAEGSRVERYVLVDVLDPGAQLVPGRN